MDVMGHVVEAQGYTRRMTQSHKKAVGNAKLSGHMLAKKLPPTPKAELNTPQRVKRKT